MAQFLKKKHTKCCVLFNTYLLLHFLYSLISLLIPSLNSELCFTSFAQLGTIHIILITGLYCILTLT